MIDEISRGTTAERILEDEVFKEAVSEVSKRLVEEWSTSHNKERREELWAQQHALTKVVENLATFMQNGEMQKRLTDTKEGWFK